MRMSSAPEVRADEPEISPLFVTQWPTGSLTRRIEGATETQGSGSRGLVTFRHALYRRSAKGMMTPCRLRAGARRGEGVDGLCFHSTLRRCGLAETPARTEQPRNKSLCVSFVRGH